MRKIPPEDKHINLLLDLAGPFGQSPQYDRMAAILGAAFLEYALKKAIKHHLKPDKNDPEYSYLFSQDDAPYRAFAALNRLARAIGIIEQWEYDHLETIRHLRNTFAHSMDGAITFDSDGVAASCDDLTIGEGKVYGMVLGSIVGYLDTDIRLVGRRRIFVLAVFHYYHKLILYHPKGLAHLLFDGLAKPADAIDK